MAKHYPMRVSVEGNCGAGKSTFLNLLEDEFGADCTIIPECVEDWRDVNGYNLLLEALAQDDRAAISSFQHYALFTTLNPTQRGNTPLIISERCAQTQEHVFWKLLCAKNLLSASTLESLKTIRRRSEDKLRSSHPDVIIYLKDDPVDCLRKVKARGRIEETGYDLEYMKALHRYHEAWLTGPAAWGFTLHTINVEKLSLQALQEEAKKCALHLKSILNKYQKDGYISSHEIDYPLKKIYLGNQMRRRTMTRFGKLIKYFFSEWTRHFSKNWDNFLALSNVSNTIN